MEPQSLGLLLVFWSTTGRFTLLYHNVLNRLHPLTDAVVPLEVHKVGISNVAVRSRIQHSAREHHSVSNVVPRERAMSEAGLTTRTAIVLLEAGKHHAHLSGKSTARPQGTQVVKLIGSCIPHLTVLRHGYLHHLISVPAFRPLIVRNGWRLSNDIHRLCRRSKLKL